MRAAKSGRGKGIAWPGWVCFWRGRVRVCRSSEFGLGKKGRWHWAEGCGGVPNYALEQRFLPEAVSKMVFDLAVTPHWFNESDRCWYSYHGGDAVLRCGPGEEAQGSPMGQRQGSGGALAVDEFSL